MQNIILKPGASFAVNAIRIFVAVIVFACLLWVVIGLISLRFDIATLPTLINLLWSQLIIFGIMAAIFTNAYIMRTHEERGTGGHPLLRYLPTIWAALMSVGMAMLIVQIWTDYKTGPNFALKIMYSLICVGSCGTYGGLVSLVRIEPNPVYATLRYAMYALAFLVGVETLDALWTVAYLSSDDTGARFGWIALTVGIVAGVFGIIGLVVYETSHKTEKGRTIGMIAYAALGMVGFSVAVFALWGALDAGAMRFVLGAATVLTIATIALWMLRNFYINSLDADTPEDTPPSESNIDNESNDSEGAAQIRETTQGSLPTGQSGQSL